MTLKPNGAEGWIRNFCQEPFLAQWIFRQESSGRGMLACPALCMWNSCQHWAGAAMGLQSQAQTGARVNDGRVDVAAVGHTAFVSLVPFRNLVSWVLMEAADPWIWQSVLR